MLVQIDSLGLDGSVSYVLIGSEKVHGQGRRYEGCWWRRRDRRVQPYCGRWCPWLVLDSQMMVTGAEWLGGLLQVAQHARSENWTKHARTSESAIARIAMLTMVEKIAGQTSFRSRDGWFGTLFLGSVEKCLLLLSTRPPLGPLPYYLRAALGNQ